MPNGGVVAAAEPQIDEPQTDEPQIPAATGTQRRPWWKKKRYVLPLGTLLGLVLLGAIFGETEEEKLSSDRAGTAATLAPPPTATDRATWAAVVQPRIVDLAKAMGDTARIGSASEPDARVLLLALELRVSAALEALESQPAPPEVRPEVSSLVAALRVVERDLAPVLRCRRLRTGCEAEIGALTRAFGVLQAAASQFTARVDAIT